MEVTTYSPGIAPVEPPWALKNLPPYRPVARKLMKLTAHADVQLEQIQQVLRMDAAFTADVLRLANSPLIGVRREIKSAPLKAEPSPFHPASTASAISSSQPAPSCSAYAGRRGSCTRKDRRSFQALRPTM